MRSPAFFKNFIIKIFALLIHQNEINECLLKYCDKKNFEFIDEVFDDFDFSYQVSDKDKKKIPSEGKLLVVSNHPLGGLERFVG